MYKRQQENMRLVDRPSCRSSHRKSCQGKARRSLGVGHTIETRTKCTDVGPFLLLSDESHGRPNAVDEGVQGVSARDISAPLPAQTDSAHRIDTTFSMALSGQLMQ